VRHARVAEGTTSVFHACLTAPLLIPFCLHFPPPPPLFCPSVVHPPTPPPLRTMVDALLKLGASIHGKAQHVRTPFRCAHLLDRQADEATANDVVTDVTRTSNDGRMSTTFTGWFECLWQTVENNSILKQSVASAVIGYRRWLDDQKLWNHRCHLEMCHHRQDRPPIEPEVIINIAHLQRNAAVWKEIKKRQPKSWVDRSQRVSLETQDRGASCCHGCRQRCGAAADRGAARTPPLPARPLRCPALTAAHRRRSCGASVAADPPLPQGPRPYPIPTAATPPSRPPPGRPRNAPATATRPPRPRPHSRYSAPAAVAAEPPPQPSPHPLPAPGAATRPPRPRPRCHCSGPAAAVSRRPPDPRRRRHCCAHFVAASVSPLPQSPWPRLRRRDDAVIWAAPPPMWHHRRRCAPATARPPSRPRSGRGRRAVPGALPVKRFPPAPHRRPGRGRASVSKAPPDRRPRRRDHHRLSGATAAASPLLLPSRGRGGPIRLRLGASAAAAQHLLSRPRR